MKISLYLTSLLSGAALVSAAGPRKGDRREEKVDQLRDANSGLKAQRRLQSSQSRNLGKGGSSPCTSCEYGTYMHFAKRGSTDYLHKTLTDSAFFECSLAYITNDAKRRAAQYAIPDGEIALTGGFLPIDTMMSHCSLDSSNTEEGTITGCSDPGFNDLFKNWDGTSVSTDDGDWVDIDFPIPDSAIYAAIGADGLLRPVSIWNTDTTSTFYYTGAVYECCAWLDDICAKPDEPDDGSIPEPF